MKKNFQSRNFESQKKYLIFTDMVLLFNADKSSDVISNNMCGLNMKSSCWGCSLHTLGEKLDEKGKIHHKQ